VGEKQVFKSFASAELREGGYELYKNWKSQRTPLTELICPKFTFIATFSAKSMVNDGNVEKYRRNGTHLVVIKRSIVCYSTMPQ